MVTPWAGQPVSTLQPIESGARLVERISVKNASKRLTILARLAKNIRNTRNLSRYGLKCRHCRFCGNMMKGKSGDPNPAFKDICNSLECQKHKQNCCTKMLACGHPCNGILELISRSKRRDKVPFLLGSWVRFLQLREAWRLFWLGLLWDLLYLRGISRTLRSTWVQTSLPLRVYSQENSN